MSKTSALEKKTRCDGLTGVYNRAYLDEVLEKEFSMAHTHQWPFGILFADIDHFKLINDTYGHYAGDRVLQRVGRILRDCTRDTDIVARYGGEEFIIILPGSNRDDSRVVANRIVQAFRSTSHRVGDDEDVVVTVSIGIAVQGQDADYASTVELVNAADRALYMAKQQGRNRAVNCLTEAEKLDAAVISTRAHHNQ